jgi:hypothetical protein
MVLIRAKLGSYCFLREIGSIWVRSLGAWKNSAHAANSGCETGDRKSGGVGSGFHGHRPPSRGRAGYFRSPLILQPCASLTP